MPLVRLWKVKVLEGEIGTEREVPELVREATVEEVRLEGSGRTWEGGMTKVTEMAEARAGNSGRRARRRRILVMWWFEVVRCYSEVRGWIAGLGWCGQVMRLRWDSGSAEVDYEFEMDGQT